MPRQIKNYENSKIYIVRNTENDKVYIGSTTQSLSKRMAEHRWKLSNKQVERCRLYVAMKQLGVSKFYIELIEEFPCSNRERLLAREGYFIREFKSHIDGYNMKIESRTKEEQRDYDKKRYEVNKEQNQERHRKYYKDNKEHLIEQAKQNYENNKTQRVEQAKLYRVSNREKIKEKESAIVECECGLKSTKKHLERHKKTRRHQQWLANQPSTSF